VAASVLPPQLGLMPMTPFSSTRDISISYRPKAVSQHRGPRGFAKPDGPLVFLK
jgi:hypothetical protein